MEGRGGRRRLAGSALARRSRVGGGRVVADSNTACVRVVPVRAAHGRAAAISNHSDGGSQRPTTPGGERSGALAPPVRQDPRAATARPSSRFGAAVGCQDEPVISPAEMGPFRGVFLGYYGSGSRAREDFDHVL